MLLSVRVSKGVYCVSQLFPATTWLYALVMLYHVAIVLRDVRNAVMEVSAWVGQRVGEWVGGLVVGHVRRSANRFEVCVFRLRAINVVKIVRGVPTSVTVFIFFVIVVRQTSIVEVRSNVLSRVGYHVQAAFLSSVVSVCGFQGVHRFCGLVFVV